MSDVDDQRRLADELGIDVEDLTLRPKTKDLEAGKVERQTTGTRASSDIHDDMTHQIRQQ